MQFIPATWQSPHALPVNQELARVTETLHRIAESVTGPKGYGRAARAVADHPVPLVHGIPAKGQQHVSTVIGNSLDDQFKSKVRQAIKRGELPPDLKVAEVRGKGPDILWEQQLAAWDLTTAEGGRDHILRDTVRRPSYLHYYWVLGY